MARRYNLPGDYEPRAWNTEVAGEYTRRGAYNRYDEDRFDRDNRKPITSRYGAGRRGRIAIETGNPYAARLEHDRNNASGRLQEELEDLRFEAKRRNETRRRRPRPPRPQPRIHSPTYAPPRRNSDDGRPADDDAEVLDPVPAAQPIGEAPLISPSTRTYLEDDSTDEEGYDFKLPVKPQPVNYSYTEDVAFPLDADSNEDARKPSQDARSKFNGAFTEVPICQSRWMGSVYDRGDLSADISVPPAESTRSEKPYDPLMKWYHLERSMMSFEEFVAAAQGVLQISEQKRRDVNKLLRDVQRKFEKQRQHGRDLEPNCVSDLYMGGPSSKQSACVMFLSFPYFCLEVYDTAQFRNLTPGTPMHPLRPLLQAHFHSTSQKRELAQAITKFPNTGSGNCLHLSQVWCLIVDGNTMITCSRQSHDNLCAPAITKSNFTANDETTKIKVSLGNDPSWLVPVNDETTWPSFLSVFGESIASLEADGAAADFRVNGESVDPEQWSFLLQAAQTRSMGLELHQSMQRPSSQLQIGSVIPDNPGAASAADTANGVTYMSEPAGEGAVSQDEPQATVVVEAPAWNEANASLEIFKYSSAPNLEYLADSLDNVLNTNSREKEKAAYNAGKATNVFAVTQLMQINSDSSQNDNPNLARTAIYLFGFFWPFAFSHSLTEKYWGGVQAILQQDPESRQAANVDGVLADLIDNVIPVMESFTRKFASSTKDLDPLPDAFSKAFLHLLMAFTLLSQTSSRRAFGVNNSTINAHIKGLKASLSAGKREITTRLKSQSQVSDLEELEICSHSSLLALVLNQFSQDVMHGKPDVASTYNDYFYQLDFRVTEDPTPRSHQESLRFFLQEVEAILSTLQYQLSVLEAFEQSLLQQQQTSTSSSSSGSGRDDNFLLRYALGESRQQIVLDASRSRIAARIDKFRGLQQRAEDLGEWHRNEMETNRDRQENAIMVFTVVTIVFLPLSYVSSVFGMNSSDVREMELGQWAYWAASIPLTVLVVVGSLWWAGEFEGFGAWVQRVLRRSSTASGYRRIPEPASYGGLRTERMRDEIDVRYAGRDTRVEDYYRDERLPERRRRTTYPRRRYD